MSQYHSVIVPIVCASFNSARLYLKLSVSSKILMLLLKTELFSYSGLYLSNAKAASDKNLLNHLRVSHVLTVEALKLPDSTFEKTNINNMFIMVYDNHEAELLPYFPIANAFIDDGMKNGAVLVHCRLGVSRSSTIIIAYLMQKYKLTYEQAFRYVRSKRPFINPNPSFVNQLKKYERNQYYVGHFKRMEAYMKVNSGENKFKVMSVVVIVVGMLLPVVVLLI